jgi:YgiT-type zinc finger domain-containing protein
LVRYERWRGDELVFVDGVPASVCDQCGEEYSDGEVVIAIDRMLKHPPTPARVVSVPVYDFRLTVVAKDEGPC